MGGAMDVRGDWEDGGVDVGRVVAKFQEEGCGGGAGDSERAAGVAIRNRFGVGEGRAYGDVFDEEEVGAGDRAGLTDVRRALKLREDGEADEVGQRKPVARG